MPLVVRHWLLVLAVGGIIAFLPPRGLPSTDTPTNRMSNCAHNHLNNNTIRALEESRHPLTFTENCGQWDERVLFRAEIAGAIVWITRTGISYQLLRAETGPIPRKQQPVARPAVPGALDFSAETRPAERSQFSPQSCGLESMVLTKSFVGANPHPAICGEGLTEYTCNFFLGNDPEHWRTDVPNYRSVYLQEIYPGIAVRYYGNDGQLAYDFLLAPGADPADIRLTWTGITGLTVEQNGKLLIETAWATITELTPCIYQQIDGRQQRIGGRYQLEAPNSVSFALSSEYDARYPLVIDPLVLVYGTYVGGNASDYFLALAVDDDGCAYAAGYTYSTDFPTLDPYQTDSLGADVIVTKLNAAGNELLYSTYLGGELEDMGMGIAIDGSGCAYVTGWTVSSDFPTENALQAEHGGGPDGPYDAFATKLSAAGNDLVYSTFLGGSHLDYAAEIAVDTGNNAYVVGSTYSDNFPTQNPFQTDQPEDDAFVVKLNCNGDALVYGTYLGVVSHIWGKFRFFLPGRFLHILTPVMRHGQAV